MIIDEITLSGRNAYLIDNNGQVRLGPGMTGKSIRVGPGEAIEVNAIDLFVQVKDTLALFPLQDSPLIKIGLYKEMFPDLYLDPYEHRVHQISGFEDFNRGTPTSIEVMEVDGLATLVSLGGPGGCRWTSARYPLPRPTRFEAIAWDLALSRNTPKDLFSYDLYLNYWTPGNEALDDTSLQQVALTSGPSTPDEKRHCQLDANLINPAETLVGYQIGFKAQVHHDSFLAERHGRLRRGDSLGTPLLQAAYLLEITPPTYQIGSLQELIAHASSYQLIDPDKPQKRLTASLNLPATLTEGERIEIQVLSNEIESLEARLDATVRTRPVRPIT